MAITLSLNYLDPYLRNKSFMKELDANGDGQVSKEEFVKSFDAKLQG